MTESFLSALREFLLAEAQECYWQQAVLRELPSCILHLADE
jgi:programmed cell death 6-interacting protein